MLNRHKIFMININIQLSLNVIIMLSRFIKEKHTLQNVIYGQLESFIINYLQVRNLGKEKILINFIKT